MRRTDGGAVVPVGTWRAALPTILYHVPLLQAVLADARKRAAIEPPAVEVLETPSRPVEPRPQLRAALAVQ